jgi:hypothetical protein
VLGLAGLGFQVARRTTRSTDRALLMSVMNARVDRASTVRFDSLSTIATCDSVISGNARVIGCTTLVPVTNVRTDARVVVWTTIPGSVPDTIVVQRSRVRYPFPLR